MNCSYCATLQLTAYGRIGVRMQTVVSPVELAHKQGVENAIRQSHLMEVRIVLAIPRKQLHAKNLHV